MEEHDYKILQVAYPLVDKDTVTYGKEQYLMGNELFLWQISIAMLVKQCHKPPMWEWFILPIYGDLGGGLRHCFTHIVGG